MFHLMLAGWFYRALPRLRCCSLMSEQFSMAVWRLTSDRAPSIKSKARIISGQWCRAEYTLTFTCTPPLIQSSLSDFRLAGANRATPPLAGRRICGRPRSICPTSSAVFCFPGSGHPYQLAEKIMLSFPRIRASMA